MLILNIWKSIAF